MIKIKKIISGAPLDYKVVAKDLPILPEGTLLRLDGNYYVNEDETIIIKSTNYTGRIIKKHQ